MAFFRKPFFIKLFNWEYWPFAAVYYPVFPIWILLCLRARAIYFFNASNPGIENGGMMNESKKDIHDIIPEDLYPKTIHFPKDSGQEAVRAAIASGGFRYPLFCKPDVGGRGKGVKKVRTEQELCAYASAVTIDFHVQETVPFENEVGIFYFRYPGETKGRITGIVKKEFLTVTGNGNQSVGELIMRDNRAIVYAESLKNTLAEEWNRVPGNGEKLIVSPYGNHARGSKFIDDSDKIDPQLTQAMDQITSRISGFNFGRLDICFRDWESLRNAENFMIIEVNGAGAEPTHMYDPDHSIFYAWKEIIRHWWIMTTVCIKNHQQGTSYLSLKQGKEMFRKYNEIQKKIKGIPE